MFLILLSLELVFCILLLSQTRRVATFVIDVGDLHLFIWHMRNRLLGKENQMLYMYCLNVEIFLYLYFK